jgi:hypothetical protein
MGFDSMTITTQDVSRSEHRSSKRRHSNKHVLRRKTLAEANSGRRTEDVPTNILRPETSTEGSDLVEETTLPRNMFSRKTSPQRTTSFRKTMFQRSWSHATKPVHRRERCRQKNDENQQEHETAHQSPGATDPANDRDNGGEERSLTSGPTRPSPPVHPIVRGIL